MASSSGSAILSSSGANEGGVDDKDDEVDVVDTTECRVGKLLDPRLLAPWWW